MTFLIRFLRFMPLAVVLGILTGCFNGAEAASNDETARALQVYKSRTCQCCDLWGQHMQDAGFEIRAHHPTDLNSVKNAHGIAPEFQSCHTAVTAEGDVFEGHVPARFIQQYLENPPADGRGLSVPGMPVGSPGMEVGDRFMPYKIWLLKKDGSTEIFATVESRDQQ